MSDTERVEITEIRIPYRDIDMNGFLHSSAYLVHAEAALAHFWRYRPPLEDEPFFLVKKVECNYHRGLRFDDLARFTVQISKIGGKSIGFNVTVEADAIVAAEIDIVWMSADRESREPVALPEDIRDWLYQFLA